MSADMMRAALAQARDQFLSYAQQHTAKQTPEANDKATVNLDMAAMCEAARTDYGNLPATGGLRDAVLEVCDILAERSHGSPARSPAHNGRLLLESALRRQNGTPTFPGQSFAQPCEREGRVGLLRFCDQDMRDMHFDDPADAWEAWNQYSPAWNCTLLLAAELPQPIPAIRAENAQVAARPAPRHPEGMKNAEAEGWRAFFAGRAATDHMFPPARPDLHQRFADGHSRAAAAHAPRAPIQPDDHASCPICQAFGAEHLLPNCQGASR